MYFITHKIIHLSQVICANGSRQLFCFRVRQFSGLKYYFTWKITPFLNLFSVCPGFRYIGGLFQAGFTVFSGLSIHWSHCTYSTFTITRRGYIKIAECIQKEIRVEITHQINANVHLRMYRANSYVHINVRTFINFASVSMHSLFTLKPIKNLPCAASLSTGMTKG